MEPDGQIATSPLNDSGFSSRTVISITSNVIERAQMLSEKTATQYDSLSWGPLTRIHIFIMDSNVYSRNTKANTSFFQKLSNNRWYHPMNQWLEADPF